MTRQEAISVLKMVEAHGLADKAKQMAIDALTQPEIIRCKDCKYRIVNENYGKTGYMKLKAMCELDSGDIFQLGRDAQKDDWFCADAERRKG